jgi:hypothetical protein
LVDAVLDPSNGEPEPIDADSNGETVDTPEASGYGRKTATRGDDSV